MFNNFNGLPCKSQNNSEDECWRDIYVLDGNGLERRVGLRNVRLCESVTPLGGENDKFAEKEEGEGS